MKKGFLLFLTGLIYFTICYAQHDLPPIYEIKSDTVFEQDLGNNYWQLLEDREGKWTIDQVTRPPFSNQFRNGVSAKNPFDTTIHVYWLRYRLINLTGRELSIALHSRSEQDDYYIFKSGNNWQHFVTGYLYPWNKKDGFKQGNYIPVTLKAGEEIIIYDRTFFLAGDFHKRLPVDFVNTRKEIEKEFYGLNVQRNDYFYANELLEAFIIGVLFISFFFNVFFYRIVHEKIYLYFSLFLIFLSINRAYAIVNIYFDWTRPDLPHYGNYLGYAWVFILFFLIQFFRKFFDTSVKYPRWDKFINGLGYLYILEVLFHMISFYFFTEMHIKTRFLRGFSFNFIPCCLFLTLFIFIPKSDRFSKLVIVGAFPLLFLYVVSAFLGSDGFFPSTLGTSEFTKHLEANYRGIEVYRSIEVVFIIWLVLLFSRVLFLRYNELRRQMLQQEQAMRNRIAADLHDDIGSTLSSISIMSELAKDKSPSSISLLNAIGESASSLQEHMSDLIWAVNPQNDDFKKMAQRMSRFAFEILEAKSIVFNFNCDETVYNERLSMDQRKKVYLFFKEAINNAAKYSLAKRVDVDIFGLDNQIVMKILDDGCGFNLEEVSLGNGLTNFSRRAEELGGKATIYSAINQGTRIELCFKIT